MLRQHEETGARATLSLVAARTVRVRVVRLREDRSVKGFVEKAQAREIDTNLINAGIYILQHDVLDGMAPAGRTSRSSASCSRPRRTRAVRVSGERLTGMDIGTPGRYLQATREILDPR